MENQKPSVPYDYKEKKYHFAGLLNTAQHNFDLALQEVNNRLGKTEKESGTQLIEQNIFDSKDSFSAQAQTIRYLEEFFPWITLLRKQIAQKMPEEEGNELYKEEVQVLKQSFISLYKLLNDLRNEQTHCIHDSVCIPKEIGDLLNALLLRTLKNTRKKTKEEDYRRFIVKKYKLEFEKEVRVKKTDENGEKKERLLKGIEKENNVINGCFKKWIEKEGEEEKLKHSTLKKIEIEGEQTKYRVSPTGFVFFLSLFLTRKELEDVMDHVQYFKDSRELSFYITRKAFSSTCFRDVRKSLRSDYSNDSLLMQMVEELYKCPKELYQVLPEEKKQEFIEDINEYYKDNPEFEGTSEEARVIHPVIRKRYQDKFPYFVLRFIDQYFNFPGLSFQLVLGEYVTDRREKEIQGISLSTERVISRKISYVAKLSEAEAKKKGEGYKETGWKEYPNPHYKIINNRIPFYIEFPKNEEDLEIENKSLKYKDLSKWKFDEINQKNQEKITGNIKIRNKHLEEFTIDKSVITPNVFLSIHELPALLHALLIEGKTEKEVENIIREKIKEQLKGIVEESRNLSGLPKGLKGIIRNKEHAGKEKLVGDIEKELKKGEEMKEEIECWLNAENKKEKQKGYVTQKPVFSDKYKGKYATWLAYDIKKFAGKDQIRNWKGYQFSELQTLLSLYSIRKEELKIFLDKELKIKLPSFLKEALSSESLEDFTLKYLSQRRTFLEGLKKKVVMRGVQESMFQYFEERRYRTYSNRLEYWEELWKHPVNLDRGLFDARGTVYDKQKGKPSSLV